MPAEPHTTPLASCQNAYQVERMACTDERLQITMWLPSFNRFLLVRASDCPGMARTPIHCFFARCTPCTSAGCQQVPYPKSVACCHPCHTTLVRPLLRPALHISALDLVLRVCRPARRHRRSIVIKVHAGSVPKATASAIFVRSYEPAGLMPARRGKGALGGKLPPRTVNRASTLS